MYNQSFSPPGPYHLCVLFPECLLLSLNFPLEEELVETVLITQNLYCILLK